MHAQTPIAAGQTAGERFAGNGGVRAAMESGAVTPRKEHRHGLPNISITVAKVRACGNDAVLSCSVRR